MMWLLAELYHNLPEVGDLPKPKLVFFFDEAHLLFEERLKAFLDQVEQVVRLIRSKGVGVYFVTQTPKDVPQDVLAQLGNRVQHALRAHTPDDEQALKATVRTFPKTSFYDLEETLTSLGIGEAVVTVLDAPRRTDARWWRPGSFRRLREWRRSPRRSSRPTSANRICWPSTASRSIGRARARCSPLVLARTAPGEATPDAAPRRGSAEKSMAEVAGDVVSSSAGRTVVREVVRGLFGLLGAKPPRQSTRRKPLVRAAQGSSTSLT